MFSARATRGREELRGCVRCDLLDDVREEECVVEGGIALRVGVALARVDVARWAGRQLRRRRQPVLCRAPPRQKAQWEGLPARRGASRGWYGRGGRAPMGEPPTDV